MISADYFKAQCYSDIYDTSTKKEMFLKVQSSLNCVLPTPEHSTVLEGKGWGKRNLCAAFCLRVNFSHDSRMISYTVVSITLQSALKC